LAQSFFRAAGVRAVATLEDGMIHAPRTIPPKPLGQAAYLGLAPTPFQSGGMDRDRRINRAGNSRARKTMVQLAWLWLRYQPESGLARWFRERVGELQGRTRRIAIIALARKLLIAIWRFVTAGVVPEGAILAA
jgi:transposase